MEDILNVGVATTPKRILRVTGVDKKPVKMKDGRTSDKIILKTVEDATGKTFDISDSWVEDNTSTKRVAGLWFSVIDGNLNPSSTLAKVLKFYEVDTIGNLIDKEVVAYPDKNDYLVLTACKMT